MNIFEQDRRRNFLNNLKIENNSMLEVYQLVKSIDLHVKGDFDLTRYGRLKTLKEESFQKESVDLKQAVMSIYQNSTDPSERFRRSCLSAIEFYLNGEPRAATCRKLNFSPESVPTFNSVVDPSFDWKRDGCFEVQDGVVVALSPLFDCEVKHINNFSTLLMWYNGDGVTNLEFFRGD